MNHNFDFQGCQKMHIRVAISQKGLIGLFANWCHLMLLGPKEWKHKSKVLRTHFKNFFIPGTLCVLVARSDGSRRGIFSRLSLRILLRNIELPSEVLPQHTNLCLGLSGYPRRDILS